VSASEESHFLKRSTTTAQSLFTTLAAALLIASAAAGADVHVMISAGYFAAYSELGSAFERATRHRLVTTRGPSMGDSPEAIPTRLAQGEIADVVILDGVAADELGRRGWVRSDTKVELAGSLIGMVVRAGAAKPDIGSVETFRRTLLAATSVRTRIAAAARIHGAFKNSASQIDRGKSRRCAVRFGRRWHRRRAAAELASNRAGAVHARHFVGTIPPSR
jgi:hypothetical protein